VVVDTQTAVWYLSSDSNLSQVASSALDLASAAGELIHVRSICLVELSLLIEKGRLLREARDRLVFVLDDPEPGWSLAPFDRDVADALETVSRAEVPDLPDRVVAATAVALRCPVVSCDRKIRASEVQTVW